MLPKLNQDFGVRALFGVIVCAGAVFTLSWLAIVSKDTTSIQILGNSLIAVIAFYFGQKSAK